MKTVASAVVVGLGLVLTTGAVQAATEVVLNEIMADNTEAVLSQGKYPDWLELYNTASATRDLSGMKLSDDPLLPAKFVFPPNTTIAAKGYLVVWCDDKTNSAGLHTGFGLAADGQVIGLYSVDVFPTLLDSVAFGPQAPNRSIGRVPDGTGTWQLTKATAGSANATEKLGSYTKLRINEWMATASNGVDWFELYNPEADTVALSGLNLTDTLADPMNTPLPPLTYIEGRGFLQFIADRAPTKGVRHVNFKLSAKGAAIYLLSPGGTLIDAISFGAQRTDISEGRLPDGSANIVPFATSSTPSGSNYLPLSSVLINEVLTHTDPPLEDAVELFNASGVAVDISGWYLSNSKTDAKKFRIPSGTVVAPGGFKVFYEYQFNPDRTLPTSFNFNSAHGDEVELFMADALGNLTGYRDGHKFGAAEFGVSFGRFVTTAGPDFVALTRRTFGQDDPLFVADFRRGLGAPNAAPKVGPVVINELMFNPPDVIVAGVTNDNVLDEFVELANITSGALPLFDPANPADTWRLANGIQFDFPPGVMMAPHGLALVVSFDPKRDLNALGLFKAKYSVGDTVPIYGPYVGKLRNSGDTVEVHRPDPPQLPPHPDAGFVPYIEIDHVKYSPLAPWPTGAAGTGASLQRRLPTAYGGDPGNWFVGAPSAGRGNGIVQIQSATAQGTSLVLKFTADPGKTYSVQYRTALGVGAWLKLTDLPPVSATADRQVTDSILTGGRARFYRVVTPAVP